MTGPPLPDTSDDITAGWLQRALNAGGAAGFPAIESIDTDVIGEGFGLLGELLRCHLTYRDDAASGPETVIVKLPSPEPRNRRLAKRLSLYKREYAYYTRIAPRSPVRSPTLLYGDFEDRSHRFVLVLEDLGGMHAVDQIAGASAAQAKLAIRSIARLHGRFWGRVDQPDMAGLHESARRTDRWLVQVVYLTSLVPTFRRFGGVFSDEMRRLAEAYGTSISDHMREIGARPRTFRHGDYRLDNMFFGPEGDDDFAVLDWQVSAVGTGVYDVVYFMAGSVPTDLRRQIEREIVEEYHAVLCETGVTGFTFEECWRLYREIALLGLVVPVVAAGALDSDDERSTRLVEVGLRRTLANIEDLEAAEFLPRRRRIFGPAWTFSAASGLAYAAYRRLR